MSKAILIVPTQETSGITSATLGLYHALDRQGVRVMCHKPILQRGDNVNEEDFSIHVIQAHCRCAPTSASIDANRLQKALDADRLDELMEDVIRHYHDIRQDYDVVLMQGLFESDQTPYAYEVNRDLARALDADIVLVANARVKDLSRLENQLDYAAHNFGGYHKGQLLGAIVNYVDGEKALSAAKVASSRLFNDRFKLLGCVPRHEELRLPRVLDIQRHLNAKIISAGDIDKRRVSDYMLFARSVPNATSYLVSGVAVLSPADRDDALMAVTISAKGGTALACLILVGPWSQNDNVMQLCMPLLQESALPVLHIETSSWEAGMLLQGFKNDIPVDDIQRVELTKEFFAENIKNDWISAYVHTQREVNLSPAAFRYQIVQRAIAAHKTIVLPEGDEPRTVEAANICAERGLANCVLLAKPENVRAVAAQKGIQLHENIRIIDPESVRERYVARLVDLRKNKGMDESQARDQLSDSVVLGTMMLEAGEVDGLVSGAVHTTANTIRPPLQIIKTAPGATTVSSVFFMCLPEQVLVYGDCAIMPNPTADELAQIAIQSHDSARSFGLEPRVAMISYSTINSGTGADVDKVKEATAKVRALRPDILVDGPLQYDAASVESVGRQKAPDSQVAGRANVFIFPDLNTGNTTYKAVQRNANAIAMGPVLQGMRKPVNDLSRGALVEDIVYTIAITAVQASA